MKIQLNNLLRMVRKLCAYSAIFYMAMCYSLAQSSEMNGSPFPFDQPDINALRELQKKVFAHYFTPFPVSIDNDAPDEDYYTEGYLAVDGESNKHLSYGGYLRERPLPRAPIDDASWFTRDMENEILQAAQLGIDGFTLDLLSAKGSHYTRVKRLLQAAEDVGDGFSVVLMPDMVGLDADKDAIGDSTFATLTTFITELAEYSSAYRLSDGRLVVSPYNAHRFTAAEWSDWLDDMSADSIDIAFFPLFQSWQTYAPAFSSFSYGLSDWGNRSVGAQSSYEDAASIAHNTYGTLWMQPVSPQDFRPKSKVYWEAQNSLNYRTMWNNAIQGGSDWVQLITWNDYSEHTEISPSSGIQYAFFDLTAYYTTWFKTGTQPEITKDVLYYFYRKHSSSLVPDLQSAMINVSSAGSDAPSDSIELLAFLKEPGTLEIEIGGQIYQEFADAGITSFKVPLGAGTPEFRLYRQNSIVESVTGNQEIVTQIDYQDFLYYAGSSSRPPVDKCLDPTNPDFVADIQQVEEGNSVTFTDLSDECVDSWNWTFEGGTPATSTEQNPVVFYETSGTYDVTLVSSNNLGSTGPMVKQDYIVVIDSGTQTFYGGITRTLPATLEAEEYDTGGPEVAFHDNATKEGDLGYRPADNVDVIANEEASNGYVVGHMLSGEWLEYSTELTEGSYDIILKYATESANPGDLQVSLDGSVLGTFTDLTTTGTNFSTDTLKNINMTGAGQHVIRLTTINGGEFDIDALSFNLYPSSVSLSGCLSGYLDSNKYYELSANFAPANATYTKLNWSSSDSSVAMVDDYGVVTTLGDGTATITVSSEVGFHTDACELMVGTNYPYGGTNHILPGIVETEEYDVGGQGIAYNDDRARQGWLRHYRPDDNVDVVYRYGASGGYAIGWGREDEWLEYTVDVTAGTYDLILSYATPLPRHGDLLVTLDGNELGIFDDLPRTGSFFYYKVDTLRNVSISGGNDKILRLTYANGAGFDIDAITFQLKPERMDISGCPSAPLMPGDTLQFSAQVEPVNAVYSNLTWTSSNSSIATVDNSGFVTIINTGEVAIEASIDGGEITSVCNIVVPTNEPYGGTARPIPGLIEGEHYDVGGQGIAYNDNETKQGFLSYRPEDNVDVVNKTTASGGYSIGWTAEGEWLEYTVDVSEGTYDMVLYYACGVSTPGDLLVELDGQELGTFADVTNSGSWTTFTRDTIKNVSVTGGTARILRMTYVNGSDFDLDAIEFIGGTSGLRMADETMNNEVSIQASNLSIYPNPISSRSYASFDISKEGPYQLDVYDISGTRVQNIIDGYANKAGSYTVTMKDFSSFSAGIYFLRLTTANEILNIRFIKD